MMIPTIDSLIYIEDRGLAFVTNSFDKPDENGDIAVICGPATNVKNHFGNNICLHAYEKWKYAKGFTEKNLADIIHSLGYRNIHQSEIVAHNIFNQI